MLDCTTLSRFLGSLPLFNAPALERDTFIIQYAAPLTNSNK
jgi:hypothetical protein